MPPDYYAPWLAWHSTSAATGTAATGALTLWPAWNMTYAATTTSTTALPWQGWNQGSVTPIDVTTLQVVGHPETAEQRQARVERAEAAQRARAAAQQRAWRLLRRHLRPDQRKTLRDARYFDVLVGATGARRRYRIHEGVAGNVRLIGPDGRPVRRYCIHPREDVPVADVLLGQMLMLKTEEREFLRIANASAAG